ncbi:MAG: RND transporter, partial [Gallionellales bacterium RBG_16_56_9]
ADSTQAEAPMSMSEGQVKKIDKDAGKITIKHGELKNLDMPPMTMVFRVKDPAMLDQVNAGNSISFVAEKLGGQLTVTRIEAKK